MLIAQSARIQQVFFEPIQSEIKAIFMKLLTIHGVKNESISKFLSYLRDPVNVPTEYLSVSFDFPTLENGRIWEWIVDNS